MKNERQGHTLQSTARVHEVYLRLIDVTKVEWRDGAQFFPVAAQMIRRLLVSAARAGCPFQNGGIALDQRPNRDVVSDRLPSLMIYSGSR